MQLRSRHRDNVLALLRGALLRGHFATAAGAIAVLLGAETFSLGSRPHAVLQQTRRTDRMAEVVWAALELLRRQAASTEQVGCNAYCRLNASIID